MDGICLTLYTYENQQHKGLLTYEWLLECAKKHKIPGASVFRAIAGYGCHGVIHEEHFFELASNVPVEVVFILGYTETEKFLDALKTEIADLFYTKTPVQFEKLTHGVKK